MANCYNTPPRKRGPNDPPHRLLIRSRAGLSSKTWTRADGHFVKSAGIYVPPHQRVGAAAFAPWEKKEMKTERGFERETCPTSALESANVSQNKTSPIFHPNRDNISRNSRRTYTTSSPRNRRDRSASPSTAEKTSHRTREYRAQDRKRRPDVPDTSDVYRDGDTEQDINQKFRLWEYEQERIRANAVAPSSQMEAETEPTVVQSEMDAWLEEIKRERAKRKAYSEMITNMDEDSWNATKDNHAAGKINWRNIIDQEQIVRTSGQKYPNIPSAAKEEVDDVVDEGQVKVDENTAFRDSGIGLMELDEGNAKDANISFPADVKDLQHDDKALDISDGWGDEGISVAPSSTATNFVLDDPITPVVIVQKPENTQNIEPLAARFDDVAQQSDSSDPVRIPSKGKGKQKKIELVPGDEEYVAPFAPEYVEPIIGEYNGMLGTFEADMNVGLGASRTSNDDSAPEPNASSSLNEDEDAEADPGTETALLSSLRKDEQERMAQLLDVAATTAVDEDSIENVVDPKDVSSAATDQPPHSDHYEPDPYHNGIALKLGLLSRDEIDRMGRFSLLSQDERIELIKAFLARNEAALKSYMLFESYRTAQAVPDQVVRLEWGTSEGRIALCGALKWLDALLAEFRTIILEQDRTELWPQLRMLKKWEADLDLKMGPLIKKCMAFHADREKDPSEQDRKKQQILQEEIESLKKLLHPQWDQYHAAVRQVKTMNSKRKELLAAIGDCAHVFDQLNFPIYYTTPIVQDGDEERVMEAMRVSWRRIQDTLRFNDYEWTRDLGGNEIEKTDARGTNVREMTTWEGMIGRIVPDFSLAEKGTPYVHHESVFINEDDEDEEFPSNYNDYKLNFPPRIWIYLPGGKTVKHKEDRKYISIKDKEKVAKDNTKSLKLLTPFELEMWVNGHLAHVDPFVSVVKKEWHDLNRSGFEVTVDDIASVHEKLKRDDRMARLNQASPNMRHLLGVRDKLLWHRDRAIQILRTMRNRIKTWLKESEFGPAHETSGPIATLLQTIAASEKKIEAIKSDISVTYPYILGFCPRVNKPDGCAPHADGLCLLSHALAGQDCDKGEYCTFGYEKCARRHVEMWPEDKRPHNFKIPPRPLTPAPRVDKNTDLKRMLNEVLQESKKYRVCIHVNKRKGCNNGANCLFNHTLEGVKCPDENDRGECKRGHPCPLMHELDAPFVQQRGGRIQRVPVGTMGQVSAAGSQVEENHVFMADPQPSYTPTSAPTAYRNNGPSLSHHDIGRGGISNSRVVPGNAASLYTPTGSRGGSRLNSHFDAGLDEIINSKAKSWQPQKNPFLPNLEPNRLQVPGRDPRGLQRHQEHRLQPPSHAPTGPRNRQNLHVSTPANGSVGRSSHSPHGPAQNRQQQHQAQGAQFQQQQYHQQNYQQQHPPSKTPIAPRAERGLHPAPRGPATQSHNSGISIHGAATRNQNPIPDTIMGNTDNEPRSPQRNKRQRDDNDGGTNSFAASNSKRNKTTHQVDKKIQRPDQLIFKVARGRGRGPS